MRTVIDHDVPLISFSRLQDPISSQLVFFIEARSKGDKLWLRQKDDEEETFFTYAEAEVRKAWLGKIDEDWEFRIVTAFLSVGDSASEINASFADLSKAHVDLLGLAHQMREFILTTFSEGNISRSDGKPRYDINALDEIVVACDRILGIKDG